MARAHPTHVAAIGPGCSTDVADMSSASSRAAVAAELGLAGSDVGPHRAVLISAGSTAPSISDDAAYPNVARLTSSERLVSSALGALVQYYSKEVPGGWNHIAVIYDDSIWASSSAQAFVDELSGLVAILGGGSCVGGAVGHVDQQGFNERRGARCGAERELEGRALPGEQT